MHISKCGGTAGSKIRRLVTECFCKIWHFEENFESFKINGIAISAKFLISLYCNLLLKGLSGLSKVLIFEFFYRPL